MNIMNNPTMMIGSKIVNNSCQFKPILNNVPSNIFLSMKSLKNEDCDILEKYVPTDANILPKKLNT